MRAALEGGGLQERFSVKDGLAGTLLRTAFKAVQKQCYCRAKADAIDKSRLS